MALIETKDMVRTGQFKAYSWWRMLWFTQFRGYRVVNTLHVPKRNMLGRLTTSKVWILDTKPDRK